MVGPGLATIALDFGISNQVVVQMNLSVFVLAYAIGPLVLGPLSEVSLIFIIFESLDLQKQTVFPTKHYGCVLGLSLRIVLRPSVITANALST